MMNPQALLEKCVDAGVLRETTGYASQQLMGMEVAPGQALAARTTFCGGLTTVTQPGPKLIN